MIRSVVRYTLAFVVIAACSSNVSGEVLTFVESVGADQLSDDVGAPTAVGTVDLGANHVEGSISTADTSVSASGDQVDSFSFEIPNGMVVRRIDFSAFSGRFSSTPGTADTTGDKVPGGANGVLTNGASFVDSTAPLQPLSGSALALNGTNQYVRVSGTPFPNTGDFTFECWLNTPGDAFGTFREIVSQAKTSDPARFYIGIDPSGQIRIGDAWLTTGVTLTSNRWVHLAVVRRASDTELYLDGELKANLGAAIPNPSTPTWMDIGQQFDGLGEFWKGEIDELRIWNIARSAAEISDSMNRTLTASDPRLVSYFPFDEAAPPAFRVSGNSNEIDVILSDESRSEFSIVSATGTLLPGPHQLQIESVRSTDPNSGELLGAISVGWEVNIFAETPETAENDDLAEAPILTGETLDVSVTNRYATTEIGEPLHAPQLLGDNQRSLWWKWVAPRSGTVVLLTSPYVRDDHVRLVAEVDSEFTKIANYVNVYEGSEYGALTLVATNEYACPQFDPSDWIEVCGRNRHVTFVAEAGKTYAFAMNSFGLDSGDWRFQDPYSASFERQLTQWKLRYVNDRIDDAVQLVGSAATIQSDTEGTRLTEPESTHLATADSMKPLDSAWWKWTAPADGRLELSATTPNTGNGQGYIQELYRMNDEAIEKIASDESMTLLDRPLGGNVRMGEEFLISFSNARVPGDGGCYEPEFPIQSQISLTFELLPPPENDAFDQRKRIGLNQSVAIGSNWGSGTEPGESVHAPEAAGNSSWWEWRSTRNGPVTINTHGSDFHTVLAVYRRADSQQPAAVDRLELVSSNVQDPNLQYIRDKNPITFAFTSRATFVAEIGETYYIAVDGRRTPGAINDLTAGNIQLNVPAICLSDVQISSVSKVWYDGPGRQFLSYGQADAFTATVELVNHTDAETPPLRVRFTADAGEVSWDPIAFTTNQFEELAIEDLPAAIPARGRDQVSVHLTTPFPEETPDRGCNSEPDGNSVKYWVVQAILEMQAYSGSELWYAVDSLPIWHTGVTGYYRPAIGPFGGVIRPDTEITQNYLPPNQFRVASGQDLVFDFAASLGLSDQATLSIQQYSTVGSLSENGTSVTYSAPAGATGWDAFVVKIVDTENGIDDTVSVWLELSHIVPPQVQVTRQGDTLQLETLVESGLENALQSTSDFKVWDNIPGVSWTPGSTQVIPLPIGDGDTLFYRVKVEP